ncbi:MAG: hypothetical protein Q8Q08_03610 [Candidatus Omnitrophota bacterium]|nr:hypothetical protein [Candidatus Omnitrophota bacterium]
MENEKENTDHPSDLSSKSHARRGKSSRKDKTLSMEMESYINGKVNFVMDNVRSTLSQEIKRELSEKTAPLRFWANVGGILAFLVAIFTWLVAPSLIKQWTEDFVVERMNEPSLKEAADRAIKSKMDEYVENKFKPMGRRIDDMDGLISIMNKNITEKQDSLILSQEKLERSLNIQQLNLKAKTGDIESYEALLEIVSNEGEWKEYAEVAIKDLELYYDQDRSQIAYSVLGDSLSLKDPGYSVEEILYEMHLGRFKEAAVNTLSRIETKTVIRDICDVLSEEKDLRVFARITRTISKLADVKIKPLEVENAKIWCAQNKNNPGYSASYNGYIQARNLIESGRLHSDAQQIMEGLESTIQSDPKALHARCLKGGLLAQMGRVEDAKIEFEHVKEINKDYYCLKFWESALALKEHRREDAIQLLNEALEKAPGYTVTHAKFWTIFHPLLSEDKVNWPEN